MEELNITAEEFCSEFDEKDECKDDEYNVCNWCDEHKPESKSEDKSPRCVAASYHWDHCLRQIAPPKKERIKHKFEWSKSKPTRLEESSDGKIFDFDKIVHLHRIQNEGKMYANENVIQHTADDELWIHKMQLTNVMFQNTKRLVASRSHLVLILIISVSTVFVEDLRWFFCMIIVLNWESMLIMLINLMLIARKKIWFEMTGSASKLFLVFNLYQQHKVANHSKLWTDIYSEKDSRWMRWKLEV